MQGKILIFILFVSSFILSGQTIEESIDRYLSGKIFWQGQDICETAANGSKNCSPIGHWTYWYENGAKMMELNHRVIKSKIYTNTLYQNMWLQDGKQILINGNGFYFNIEGSFENVDSLVFQIRDSIKDGEFKRFRKYKSGSYFLIESGQYINSKKSGIFKFRDTIRLISEEKLYENENEFCNYKYLHSNFRIREEGKKINGSKEGLWKFYNDEGLLWKEVNYKNGSEFGEYKEYHLNAKIKTVGQYTHVKGFVKGATFDSEGNEHIKKELSENIPQKYGEWKYYDQNGKLLKTKTYKVNIKTTK
jgi:antitoxin component YwqK of YwqJK toxin-antitoxin module